MERTRNYVVLNVRRFCVSAAVARVDECEYEWCGKSGWSCENSYAIKWFQSGREGTGKVAHRTEPKITCLRNSSVGVSNEVGMCFPFILASCQTSVNIAALLRRARGNTSPTSSCNCGHRVSGVFGEGFSPATARRKGSGLCSGSNILETV